MHTVGLPQASRLWKFSYRLQIWKPLYQSQYLTKGLAFSVHRTLVSPNRVHAAHAAINSSINTEKNWYREFSPYPKISSVFFVHMNLVSPNGVHAAHVKLVESVNTEKNWYITPQSGHTGHTVDLSQVSRLWKCSYRLKIGTWSTQRPSLKH